METISPRAFSCAGVHSRRICFRRGQALVTLGAQLLNGLHQRHMFAQGAFDNREQLLKWHIVRNGGEAQGRFFGQTDPAESTSRRKQASVTQRRDES